MKPRSFLLILLLSGLGMNGLSQVISSEKASIQVNTLKEEAIADEVPPEIILISPSLTEDHAFTTRENNINFIGQVRDESEIRSLFINGSPVELNENNMFVTGFNLDEGENDFSIIAIDRYGNFRENNVSIHFTPEIVFRTVGNSGEYYALLIGIDDYDHPSIDDLDNPVKDAEKLSEVLINHYSFKEENVSILKNATRADIIMALDHLSNTLTADDNLLIFYAGHGWWDAEADVGYWLPSDASRNTKAAWFRNSALVDYLKEIDTKHTLLIADACFGGAIFNTRSAFDDANLAINKLYELPSRNAMTSGTLTEVPDNSAFTRFLIDRLSENEEKYLSSQQLFSSFRIAVINNSDAVPKFGEIKNVGDEGGDFIFIKK